MVCLLPILIKCSVCEAAKIIGKMLDFDSLFLELSKSLVAVWSRMLPRLWVQYLFAAVFLRSMVRKVLAICLT